MDARPLLETLARALHDAGLEAILIGNAAAALQGAPVTTVDFDFFFRKTPRNIAKLKAVAKALGAVIFRPYYLASGLFRLVRDEDGWRVDFRTAIDGLKFANGVPVSSLAAILDSKRPPSLPRMKRARVARSAQHDALKAENEIARLDMIRRLLAKPPEQRTHFLRKKVGFRATAL
jgi:hypothetical protein